MKLKIHPRIVANFFLDGAKIIFGSLVIGMLVPGVKAIEFPYATFIFGILLTIVFFVAANIAAYEEDTIKLNQS